MRIRSKPEMQKRHCTESVRLCYTATGETETADESRGLACSSVVTKTSMTDGIASTLVVEGRSQRLLGKIAVNCVMLPESLLEMRDTQKPLQGGGTPQNNPTTNKPTKHKGRGRRQVFCRASPTSIIRLSQVLLYWSIYCYAAATCTNCRERESRLAKKKNSLCLVVHAPSIGETCCTPLLVLAMQTSAQRTTVHRHTQRQ